MKNIAILLLTLLISLTLFGTVVVTYANDTVHVSGQVQATVTPQPTAQPTKPTVTPTSVPLKPILYQGNSNKPEIALTFDDGPHPVYTPQVLSILEQYGIHATFFAIGEQVQ